MNRAERSKREPTFVSLSPSIDSLGRRDASPAVVVCALCTLSSSRFLRVVIVFVVSVAAAIAVVDACVAS